MNYSHLQVPSKLIQNRTPSSPLKAGQALRRAALLTVAAGALMLSTPTLASATTAVADRTLDATDTASLHYVRSSGSLLIEEGTAQGTLPGSMHARCNVGATFTATFTFYLKGGSITGHGTASPHGSGIYESFAGTLTVTAGTGRYSHAHGHAGLYGTFDRRTYAIRIKTTGSLSY